MYKQIVVIKMLNVKKNVKWKINKCFILILRNSTNNINVKHNLLLNYSLNK